MVNSQFNNSKMNLCNESKVKIWSPLSQSKYLQVSFSCSHKSRQQDIKYLAFSKPLSGHKTVQNGLRNVKDIFKQPMYIYSLKRFYWGKVSVRGKANIFMLKVLVELLHMVLDQKRPAKWV